jgi:hypothetical protein
VPEPGLEEGQSGRQDGCPAIGSPGVDATIQCPTSPTFTPPTTASDGCDPSPQIIEVSDVKTPGACAGTYDETKTWKSKDACGNLSAPVSQTIHVIDTTPPTVGAPGEDATIQCPTTPSFTPPATAHDDCDESPQIVEISDVKTPGSCAGAYDETKTWKAKDACGNLSAPVSQTIHVIDTTAPTIGAPGADQTIACTSTPAFSPPTTAHDDCDQSPQIIEVGDVKTPGACAGKYDETKTWKAKDACGNLSEPVSQTIHVVDTTPPAIGAPGADATVQCPTTPVFTAPTTATDACDPSPQIIEISDVKTPGSCAGKYDETKTWKAKDACGNLSAPVSQTIHVIDTTAADDWRARRRRTIQCPATPSFSPPTTAHDDCDSSPQIIEISDVKTPGSCAGKYDETKTWKAKDACGNLSAPVSQTIHVTDTTPPTLGAAGAEKTIQCPTAPVFTPPAAHDDCDPSPQVLEIGDVKTPGSCAGKYDETKTWQAKDACGNLSGSVSQTIHVIDTTAPTIGAAGPDATIECPATPTFTAPTTAHDDCDGAPQIVEISDVKTPGACAGKYDETKTWKAKDACGNLSAPVSQTIHVVDTTPPLSRARRHHAAVVPEQGDVDVIRARQLRRRPAGDVRSALGHDLPGRRDDRDLLGDRRLRQQGHVHVQGDDPAVRGVRDHGRRSAAVRGPDDRVVRTGRQLHLVVEGPGRIHRDDALHHGGHRRHLHAADDEPGERLQGAVLEAARREPAAAMRDRRSHGDHARRIDHSVRSDGQLHLSVEHGSRRRSASR